MKHLAVYCGSSYGASPAYQEAAVELGKEMVRRGLTLVYGGSSVGIMGVLADTVIAEGGQTIGVIPQVLVDREISHQGLTELHVVGTMHDRKFKMAELADAFLALPGGPGTMEEFFEAFTWAQIGIHSKPIGMLNVNRYYDPMISLFEHMVREQFMQPQYQSMAIIEPNVSVLLDMMSKYEAPAVKSYVK